jgi:hypothetical protein
VTLVCCLGLGAMVLGGCAVPHGYTFLHDPPRVGARVVIALEEPCYNMPL